jgi:hypothetical protein
MRGVGFLHPGEGQGVFLFYAYAAPCCYVMPCRAAPCSDVDSWQLTVDRNRVHTCCR